MRIKRTLAMSLTLLLLVSALLGCGSQASPAPAAEGAAAPADAATPADGPLPPVTLKITMPGDRPADMDVVIAEIEKRLEGSLNVKLNIVFAPFSDIQQKNQVSLASGEENDLVFDQPSAGMLSNIDAGYYEPLDDLLAEYAPTVVELRGEEMMDANRFGGQIYAIPMGANYKQGKHFDVRADLRKELGLAEITTREALIEYAYAVKENYPDLVPIVAGSLTGEQSESWAGMQFCNDNGPEFIERTDALASSLVLYYAYNDGKVYNLFDTKEPKIWERILEARQLYQDGIIYPDILSLKSYRELIFQNEVAMNPRSDFIPEEAPRAALKKIVPTGEVESVILTDFETKGNTVASLKQWNFQCLATVSKNKERALQFLEWTTQKENYDLLAYGIEGVHWKPKGDDMYEVISDRYRWFPYAWIWNPVHDRISAAATPREYEAEKAYRDLSTFTLMPTLGFTFDPAPVQNEIAQHLTVEAKYYGAIFNGVVDPEEYFEQWKSEDYDNVKTIQEELQRQIDAFIASK